MSATRLFSAFSTHILEIFREHTASLVNLFQWLTVLRVIFFFLYTKLSLTDSRNLFDCWPSSRSPAWSPPENHHLRYRDFHELFKEGYIHPSHHEWLVWNVLPPWWHSLTSLLDYDPQTLTQLVASHTEDIHSSDTLLHIKANPWPGLLHVLLLKSLCPSTTALQPHNSPIMPELLLQRWSSMTAYTALFPPAWPINFLATTFLLQSILQYTSVIFYRVSLQLIKALGFVARQ